MMKRMLLAVWQQNDISKLFWTIGIDNQFLIFIVRITINLPLGINTILSTPDSMYGTRWQLFYPQINNDQLWEGSHQFIWKGISRCRHFRFIFSPYQRTYHIQHLGLSIQSTNDNAFAQRVRQELDLNFSPNYYDIPIYQEKLIKGNGTISLLLFPWNSQLTMEGWSTQDYIQSCKGRTLRTNNYNCSYYKISGITWQGHTTGTTLNGYKKPRNSKTHRQHTVH